MTPPNPYADARDESVPSQLPTPAKALTIGAHPDDAEFGSGGTLARWAANGCEVSMLIVTDGSKGSWDPSIASSALASARQAEQARAAEVLGATGELIHLGYVDGELEYSMELRRRLCEWIRRLRPEVVLSHDPWRRYMLHPDHRATGLGAVDGVVAARDHLFFPELGLEKHRPEALLLWSADEPDYWEDIGSTFDQKIDALLSHSSQAETSMSNAQSDQSGRSEFLQRMRAAATANGETPGYALAEAFKLIRP